MTSLQFDPERYKAAQRREWDDVALAWKKWWTLFERGAQPVSNRLVELAGAQPGHRILDVSTGIGEPAVTLARKIGPNGHVVATDQSTAMLAVAQERVAELGLQNVELVHLDSEVMSFPPESFDGAVCRWGLMFLPDLVEALTRIRQALKPGAKFATSVWAPAEKNPFISLPMGVARQTLQPPPPPPPPDAPNLFKLGAPGAIESAFANAGFNNVQSEVFALTMTFASPEEYTEFMREIAPPVRALVADRSPEVQSGFWNTILERARGFAGPNGEMKMSSEAILAVGSA